MQRPNGTMLFYTRDSGGKHETTPTEYVDWAIIQSKKHKLKFTGMPADIKEMISSGLPEKNDLYLDYDVCGNTISRPGLNALFARIEQDPTVSHVAIPRRDRLARPDTPLDGMRFDEKFDRLGVTIIYSDKVVSPTPVGCRRPIGDLIVSLVEHEESGKFRLTLAEKMLRAQLMLAKNGYSTGGRAPYGFRRTLVKSTGEVVRQLGDGEVVKIAGHHVVWMPGPEEELNVIRLIVELLLKYPATQVARILNDKGIPSPNAGRYRTDGGVKHAVPPTWRPTAIINIARNPLLVAMSRYGLRSMGDQLRFSKSGPRLLTDADHLPYTDGSQRRVKVIRNPKEEQISVRAKFDPLINPEVHQELQKVLDQRAGVQRGVPRSRDPHNNPLGCRIFDMECGWPMYRQPYQESYRYLCGLYQQSGGHTCAHNHVSGPWAAQIALSCLQQQILNPQIQLRVREQIRLQLQSKSEPSKDEANRLVLRSQLSRLDAELVTIQGNMARAKSDCQFQAISEEFEKQKACRDQVETELSKCDPKPQKDHLSENEIVDQVIGKLENLTSLVQGGDSQASVLEMIRTADIKMFLRFSKVQQGKRTVNKVCGGIITMGDAPLPIKVYTGATDRKSITRTNSGKSRQKTMGLPKNGKAQDYSFSCEDDMLGNESRGERI